MPQALHHTPMRDGLGLVWQGEGTGDWPNLQGVLLAQRGLQEAQGYNSEDIRTLNSFRGLFTQTAQVRHENEIDPAENIVVQGLACPLGCRCPGQEHCE